MQCFCFSPHMGTLWFPPGRIDFVVLIFHNSYLSFMISISFWTCQGVRLNYSVQHIVFYRAAWMRNDKIINIRFLFRRLMSNVFNSGFYYNLSHLEHDISWSWRWRHSGIQISHLLPGQTASLVWNFQGKSHLHYHIQHQSNMILGKFRCAVSSRVPALFSI